MEHACCELRKQVEALQEQAAAVQSAVVQSQGFRHVMLDYLLEGCCQSHVSHAASLLWVPLRFLAVLHF